MRLAQIRFRGGYRRPGLVGIGLGDGPYFGQFEVAGGLFPSQIQISLRGGHRGFSNRYLIGTRADVLSGQIELSLGILECELVVFIFDFNQQLAGLDQLVLDDVHFGDEP